MMQGHLVVTSMKPGFVFTSLLSASILLFPSAASSSGASNAELQAFTRRQVSSVMVRGKLVYIDLENSQIRSLAPGKNHPDIFYSSQSSLYALCITATDDKGKEVPVDIYATRINGKLALVDITYGSTARQGFMKLVKSGQFKRI
jgi:hypothetical protein